LYVYINFCFLMLLIEYVFVVVVSHFLLVLVHALKSFWLPEDKSFITLFFFLVKSRNFELSKELLYLFSNCERNIKQKKKYLKV
jgi:hypothetical protein